MQKGCFCSVKLHWATCNHFFDFITTYFQTNTNLSFGNRAEYTDAKPNLAKPPKGKHSVKGVGQTEPDPKEKLELPTGTVVPYGKPVPAPVKRTSLLYNE